MAAPLIPQEIYLLERYSSLEYFGRMRDAFAACVKAADEALAAFMRHLPPDYRSRPLNGQPDVVWGERILPNMRWAVAGLNEGYIRISHGDLDALGMAGNVTTTFSSINRDYSWEWMPQPFLDETDRNETIASKLASNIAFTARGEWLTGALSSRYNPSSRGPLDAPATWPQYRLNSKVRVKTDDKVPRNGIYLPDLDGSSAQLLIEGYEAWQATIPDPPPDPRITSAARKRFDSTWTLVERIADSGGGIPGADDPLVAGVRLRCEAGTPCPQSGWWATPARVGGRQFFARGVLMPDVGGDYGTTIWQWDERQD